MTTKALVTGAIGLAGSAVCALARTRGYAVKGLVRSKKGTEPLQELGVELVEGDIEDPGCLAAASTDVDGIIHTAAAVGGSWSTCSEDGFWLVNYGADLLQRPIGLHPAGEPENMGGKGSMRQRWETYHAFYERFRERGTTDPRTWRLAVGPGSGQNSSYFMYSAASYPRREFSRRSR